MQIWFIRSLKYIKAFVKIDFQSIFRYHFFQIVHFLILAAILL